MTTIRVQLIGIRKINELNNLMSPMQKILEQKVSTNFGYHIDVIQKGVLGESSKIREELDEFLDAEKQKCTLMALLELADLLGAIEAYLEKKKYGVTLEDLQKMSSITKRAFKNGHRK